MRLSLTQGAAHAVRAVDWLARQPAAPGDVGAGRQKAAAIAAGAGIPPTFAARVLAQLQRRGIVRARAGRDGGYTLAEPAGEISLLAVIEAMEGPVGAPDCLLRDQRCGVGGDCPLHPAWAAAQGALRAVLAETPVVPAAVPVPAV
jgi:Rrf2 family protein